MTRADPPCQELLSGDGPELLGQGSFTRRGRRGAAAAGRAGAPELLTTPRAGLALGTRGWAAAFDATLLACLVTLPIILVMLLRGRRQLPMGPGILVGALAVLLI